MQTSGALRRGVANACLNLFLLFENCEVGVCAKLISPAHKTHPSCPDLIRASINLRKKILSKKDGSPGHQARRRASRFRPVTTVSMALTVSKFWSSKRLAEKLRTFQSISPWLFDRLGNADSHPRDN